MKVQFQGSRQLNIEIQQKEEKVMNMQRSEYAFVT